MLVEQRGGLVGARHRFAPVADDLDPVLRVPQLLPVAESADVGPRTFVDGDDAQRGSGVERGHAGPRSLRRSQQGARGGTHLVMGVGRHGCLRMKAVAVQKIWR